MTAIYLNKDSQYGILWTDESDFMLIVEHGYIEKNGEFYNVAMVVSKAPGLNTIDEDKKRDSLKPNQPVLLKVPYKPYKKYNKDAKKYVDTQPSDIDVFLSKHFEEKELVGKVWKGNFMYDPRKDYIVTSGVMGDVVYNSLKEAEENNVIFPPLPESKNNNGNNGKGSYMNESQKLEQRLSFIIGRLNESSDEELKAIKTLHDYIAVSTNGKPSASTALLIWEHCIQLMK